jgi:general secretion pathway protein H
MLVALALMALFAGLLLPALVTPVSSELRAAGARVSSMLRRTREAAVNASTSEAVRIDIETASLVRGETLLALRDGISVELFTARSELESDTVGRVRFFPDGSSTGGRITLSMQQRRYMVDVDWLTGRVNAFDPDLAEVDELPSRYEVLR